VRLGSQRSIDSLDQHLLHMPVKIAKLGAELLDNVREVAHILLTRARRLEMRESAGRIRLTIVQFGDYAEAYWRFASGGDENYYAQRYSVDFVSSLAGRSDVEAVTVVCLSSSAVATKLPNGVRTVGLELYPRTERPRIRQLVQAVAQSAPTHLIVMSPITQLIRWGLRARIPTLPMFADSFRARGLRTKLRAWQLTTLLNHSSIEFVANHNLAASMDLERIGVHPSKVVPFDWPAVTSPRDFQPKEAPGTDRPFRLIYVGSVIETKGVGDAVRAIGALRARRRNVELTVVGRGDIERFKTLAGMQHVEQFVDFLGPKAHKEILLAMRQHDAVLVPSHWAYPEGLPMTLYESLCVRTPLLASDHPMFALRIRNGESAIVFPERNPEKLAAAVERLMDTPELYAKLSEGAEKAAESYLCPLKYDRMISSFVSSVDRKTLSSYSLARYRYTR
jgi:glycosyltransferase involved in cell wall biosynthesis